MGTKKGQKRKTARRAYDPKKRKARGGWIWWWDSDQSSSTYLPKRLRDLWGIKPPWRKQ